MTQLHTSEDPSNGTPSPNPNPTSAPNSLNTTSPPPRSEEQRFQKADSHAVVIYSQTALGPNLNEHLDMWICSFHNLYESSTLIK